MEIAGIVIGSIALFLSLFSSAYAALQVRRSIRFGRLVFHVEEAELAAGEEVHFKKNFKSFGPGHFVLNVRGGS